eukprot:TRINITY_DN21567_c0_g2_i1.p1 TRINITY_DN21567_c0_g2~~TRINITY_DN21567_c0_g2_i1.p1  ORF type:complete len:298 (+),score=29.28 TRINITY_DN21567_c0_g2_i1:113-1006(+)
MHVGMINPAKTTEVATVSTDTVRPLYTFPSKQFRSPEAQYEKEMKLCAKEEVEVGCQEAERSAELVRRFFGDMLQGMHQGTIPEVYTSWLTEDIEWMSCKFIPLLYAVGRKNCMVGYNHALNHFLGGPNSSVIFTIHSVLMLGKDRTRITFKSDITSPSGVPPTIKEMYARVRGNQICEILMMPAGETILPPSPRPKFELPPPSISRPCRHNNWDSVRIKNQIALLRCRICTSQWKIKVPQIKKCNNFTEGTCTRPKCPFLHIYVRKQTRAELEQRYTESYEFPSAHIVSANKAASP